MFRPKIGRFLPTILFANLALVAACSSTNQNSQPATTSPSPSPARAAASPSAVAATPAKKVNLNTASRDEFLAAIPNLGNRMVHEFEEYRPYKSIQQFRKEIGKYVSPEQVSEYEKYVFVPIDPNQADAATLQQIPGLDAAEAEALVKGRPYASTQAFLTKLAEKTSAADVETAKTLLIAQ